MNTKRDVAKKIAKFVVGTSVGYTVTSALRNNTTKEKPHQKAESLVGGFVVGAMVAEKSDDWTSRKVDAVFDFIEAFNKAD